MKLRLLLASSLMVTLMSPSFADDYGCKVLLCLSNPSGPKAVSECVPPINQLFDDMAHGRPFPTCDQATSPTGNSYAKPGSSYYDPCPSGSTALDAGLYGTVDGNTALLGIGNGDGVTPDGYSAMPPEVCVGALTGTTNIMMYDAYGLSTGVVSANVYDKIDTVSASTTPSVIDVYINGTLYRRVRY